MTQITPQRLAELVAKAKEKRLAATTNIKAEEVMLLPQSKEIVLNSKQQEFTDYIIQPQRPNCVLTGAAGTGKTTTIFNGLTTLLKLGKIPPMQESTKWIKEGSPSIISCCWTRRATKNLKNNLPIQLRDNCVSIHKLLQFAPEYIDTIDIHGTPKKSMVFTPTYNKLNKLPASITTIVLNCGTC
jgi:hypothetical protein